MHDTCRYKQARLSNKYANDPVFTKWTCVFRFAFMFVQSKRDRMICMPFGSVFHVFLISLFVIPQTGHRVNESHCVSQKYQVQTYAMLVKGWFYNTDFQVANLWWWIYSRNSSFLPREKNEREENGNRHNFQNVSLQDGHRVTVWQMWRLFCIAVLSFKTTWSACCKKSHAAWKTPFKTI